MSRQPLTRTDMHAEIGIGLEWNVQYHCYKSDKQITKNKTRTHAGDTRFNVENPFQHRRGKNHGRQPAKLHYIGECLQTP
jgi:hypothetical protein